MSCGNGRCTLVIEGTWNRTEGPRKGLTFFLKTGFRTGPPSGTCTPSNLPCNWNSLLQPLPCSLNVCCGKLLFSVFLLGSALLFAPVPSCVLSFHNHETPTDTGRSTFFPPHQTEQSDDAKTLELEPLHRGGPCARRSAETVSQKTHTIGMKGECTLVNDFLFFKPRFVSEANFRSFSSLRS
jgi:hypothetical protein